MKKFLVVAMSVLGLSSAALADTDYGLEVGLRQQSGDSAAANTSTDSQNGMQFGGFAHFPIFENLHIRTGMLYTERSLKVKNDLTTVSTKYSMTYLDVPAALLYKFEEGAGVYGGVSFGMNLDASSDQGADPKGVTSPLTSLIFGAFFKFHPNFGVNVYYEGSGGDVADNLEKYRAVGANLMITFD